MDQMHETTENRRSVVIQKTRICNYGQARYKIENALKNHSGYDLTTEFKNTVRLLPSTYSVHEYVRFLDDWGTVSQIKLIRCIYSYHYACWLDARPFYYQSRTLQSISSIIIL